MCLFESEPVPILAGAAAIRGARCGQYGPRDNEECGPCRTGTLKRLLDTLVQELTPATKNARAYLGPGMSALVKPLRDAGFRPVVATREGEDDSLLIEDLRTVKVTGQRPDVVVVLSSDGDMVPAFSDLVTERIRMRAVVVMGSVSGSLYGMAEQGAIELVESTRPRAARA